MAILYGKRINQGLITGAVFLLRELVPAGLTITVKIFAAALPCLCFIEIPADASAGIKSGRKQYQHGYDPLSCHAV